MRLMHLISFNRIYAALLIVALIAALVNPKPLTDKARAQMQRFFAPVSSPVRSLAIWVRSRISPDPADTAGGAAGRTYQQIADENRDLRLEVVHLTDQLSRLQQINADREALGELRELCRPMRVAGADAGVRKALSLDGSVQGLKPGMAVLYAGGLAGRVDRIGWSMGAQAQLVTDGSFRVLAKFGRMNPQPDQPSFRTLTELPVLLEGDGGRALIARTVKEADAKSAGLAVGDWAIIADEEFPSVLQGYRIGQIAGIRPSRSPQFVEVIVEPPSDLMKLKEVMVLVK